MRNVVLILIVVIIILGCGKEETKHADITFNVNETLLSSMKLFPEINISFKPPVNWKEIDKEMLNKIQNRITETKDSTELNPLPIKIFMDMERSCTCFVSLFNSTLLANDLMENYLNDFRSDNHEVSLSEGSFSHSGIDFHQIIFSKENNITIKLISTNVDQQVFMVDYVVPSKYYEEELRSIESSIGSIKKIK